MKQSLPLILTLAAVAIIGSQFMPSTETAQYQTREAIEAQSAFGAAQIRHENLANPLTGEIDYEAIAKVEREIAKLNANRTAKSNELDWTSAGPNNVGGRTRAIHVDTDNINSVWIGAVSGGLFHSNNGGAEWERVESFSENLMVSSLTRTGDGRLYVGTGHRYESEFVGNGLYTSGDDGATWSIVQDFTPNTTFGTSDVWSSISVLVADKNVDDRVWIAYTGGLATYDWGATDVDERLTNNTSSIQMSDDGEVIIASSSNRVYVSTDGGENFEDRSGNDSGEVPSSGIGRLEVAVSPDQPDFMYAFAAATNSYMRFLYASTDRGDTWYQLYGSSNNGALPFSPFSNSIQGQGIYDNCITVVPGEPRTAVVGGIRIFSVEIVGENPPIPQWNTLNINFSNGPNPAYVHSDVHTFHWDPAGTLYIGCDGGIFKTVQGQGFLSANYNYRSTQFYGMDYNSLGHVIAGAQDNGTHIITGFGISSNDSFQPLGGDGFDCNMSKFDAGLAFGTIYNNDVQRSFDGGTTGLNIVTPDEYPGPFWTVIDLYERIDENQATAIIPFSSTVDIPAGDSIFYTSLNYNLGLAYELPTSYSAGDTILLPDPAQSLFCVGGIGSFRITRDATRNTVGAGDIDWVTVSGVSGTVTSFEFSPDGDHVYVGTSTGRVYRMSGMRDAYTMEEIEIAATSLTQIYSGAGVIRDMATDVNNPNRLMIARPGYSNQAKVLISESAATTTGSTSFDEAWNFPSDLSLMPAYSCSFDVNTPDRILAGTEYGVWLSDDLGATWTECNAGMGRVPVYSLEQQTLSDADAFPLTNVLNEGVIYAGTYGRGIYYVGDYALGLDEISSTDTDLIQDLNVYPNPTADRATLALELTEASDVLVQIFDLNGRLVSNLPQGMLNTGDHYIDIDATPLAAGTFIVTVHVGDSYQSTRLNVTK